MSIFENLNLVSFFALTLLSLIFLYKWLLTPPSKRKLAPPSPPKLPVVGHLHLIGKLAYRSLQSLSQKYGDLMLLYFGSRPTLVVSSAKAAQEIMKTHDLIFANRPKSRFIHRLFYEGNDVAFDSYGESWRQKKSICVLQLLSNKRVQSLRPTREEEVGQLIEEIKSYNGEVMNLSKTLMMLFNGLICRTALGKKYNNNGNDKSSSSSSTMDCYKLFKELFEMMITVSFGDYIPYLGWVDKLIGSDGRVEKIRKQFDDLIEEVIRDHEARFDANQVKDDEEEGNKVKDFVDVLLEIQRENIELLSRENVKALIMDIFVGGTETSATTVEWAMTELLKQPKIMKRLQEEVRFVVKDKARVTEDDVENMKYLKAVIKETLRLHPPVPMLLFRESSQKVTIDKYDIGPKTQVIINAWAIQRDPNYWHDPENFIPERFLDDSQSVDYRGQQFQFIPFGSGRRTCPAITYSIVNTEFVLANLVYEFEWLLPDSMNEETLDTKESMGLVVGRLNPLMVIATPTLPSP